MNGLDEFLYTHHSSAGELDLYEFNEVEDEENDEDEDEEDEDEEEEEDCRTDEEKNDPLFYTKRWKAIMLRRQELGLERKNL